MSAKSGSLQYLIDAVSGSPKMNITALQAGHFTKDNTQTAVHFTGKKAVVFSFQLQKQLKAIKIWPLVTSEELRTKYAITEKYINKTGLDYFVKSVYLKEGINLNGIHYDALLMDWAGRQTIKEYIHSNLDQKENIHALAEKILFMHKALNRAGISHGHLHAGNIYTGAGNDLKLIGYDTVFIMGETSFEQTEQSYPDYTHPSGKQQGIKADYFAALILYLGTKAIAQDAVLWGRYKVGFQEGFLFSAADYADIKNAGIYKYLRKMQSPEIGRLLDILVLYCEAKDPSALHPFYIYLEKDPISIAPSISTTAKNTVTIETSKTVYVKKPVERTVPFKTTAAQDAIPDISGQPYQPAENKPSPKLNRVKAKKEAALQAATNRKKKFLGGGILICLSIVAAGYFLGDLADKANTPSFDTEKKVQQDLNIIAKKTAPVQNRPAAIKTNTTVAATPVVKNNIHEPAATNQLATAAPAEKKPLTIPAQPTAASTTNAVAKNDPLKTTRQADLPATNKTAITVLPVKTKTAEPLVVSNSGTMAHTEKKPVNTIQASKPSIKTVAPLTVNTTPMIAKNTVRKSPGRKVDAEKINSSSFRIGTPPKD